MAGLPGGTVTFLFTDIEGSTRLLRLLGDRYAEVLADHQRLLRVTFAEHGGREVDTQGDSFFVAFGGARDAVTAASAAQRALAEHGWADGAMVRVRMGIHTGEPAVGEERYLGLDVHRAARIGAAAHGGQVLCSQVTCAVLGDDALPGSRLRELGAYRLKDFERPEPLYQLEIDGLQNEFPPLRASAETPARLVPAGDVPLPGPLVPVPPFPFVGREGELAALRAALERAEGGEGGLVLLSAEAGGGKTRLVRELAHEAAARGTVVLYGSSDAAVTTPYQPLLEWFAFLIRVCEPDALRGCLGGRASTLARLVPDLDPTPTTEGEADRYLLQTAIAETLTRLSRVQPLLVVADDVHWADGETLHLLRRLARAAPEARLLVLAAYRGEEAAGELAGTLADLGRLDGVTRLVLGGLSPEEMGAFVRGSAEAKATPELLAALGELTDGTPLLLCELWRDLRESGAVEVANTIRLTRPVGELRGPERLGELVRQRLARLAPETSALVEFAAVAGARFELRVVGAAAGLDRRGLIAAVEEAARGGIVEELPDPTPACRFTHELVRRAVYDRITRLRRAELHLQVGEALERTHAAELDRVLPELAHHFTEAAALGSAERAAAYNLRAGYAAIAQGAYGEGATRLASALELGVADDRERAHVQIELAHLLRNVGRWSAAEALMAKSVDAVEGLEDRDLVARARLARAWIEIWNPDAEFERLVAVGEQAVETLTEVGDARGLAEAWRLLGIALRRRGRQEEARAVLMRAYSHRGISGGEGGWAGRGFVSTLASTLCDGPMTTAEAIDRCEELWRATSHAGRGGAVTCCLSALLAMAGRFDEARDAVDLSSRALDEAQDNVAWVYRYPLAAARELLGDQGGAERDLETTWIKGADHRGGAPDWRAMEAAHLLALLYCDDGRWDDAQRCLEYGRDVPVTGSFTPEAALGLAARARLAANRGELAEAVALAQRGVELAERSDMLNLRARVRLALAEVQRAGGRNAEADTAVAAALALYEQKGNVAAAAAFRAGAPGRAGVGV